MAHLWARLFTRSRPVEDRFNLIWAGVEKSETVAQ